MARGGHGARPIGTPRALARSRSNEYPLHLVERHFLGAAIVKLRRARRGMVRHLRGAFKRAAVLQIGGDARGAKGVIADARGDRRRLWRAAESSHRRWLGAGDCR